MAKQKPKRKVLFIDWSRKKTRRGNPEHYFYLLSCGHVLVKNYTGQARTDAFIVLKAQLYLEKGCYWCAKGKPVNTEDIHTFFGSAGLRMMDIHNEEKKLRDYMPNEAIWGGEYGEDEKYWKYLDQVVVRKHNRTTYQEQNIPLQLLYSRMPFKEKCIHVWWELENGYGVAWNENPSRGWSFPVKKLKDYESVLK